MRIQICSQVRALELAAGAKVKTSVISITSIGEENVSFPENGNLLSILHLKFNDLQSEYDEEGIPYGRPLPVQEDFSGLKAFVQELSCDFLIIHCWEGRSRSAAVAKAVYEFRKGRDDFRMPENSQPNPLVYTLALQALK